jgi:hypothetical protein
VAHLPITDRKEPSNFKAFGGGEELIRSTRGSRKPHMAYSVSLAKPVAAHYRGYNLSGTVCWALRLGLTMLQNLSADVSDCLRRAEECAARAKCEPNPAAQRDFYEMELRWLRLARSFQFTEQLRTFQTHQERLQDRQLTERLERLRGKLSSG